MNQVYKSQDHGWLLVHGGLTTMRQRGRYRARKVIVTTQRERERFVRILTNDATWRRCCRDGHTTALIRGSR
jgi:hypothetical protein